MTIIPSNMFDRYTLKSGLLNKFLIKNNHSPQKDKHMFTVFLGWDQEIYIYN